MNKKKRRSLKKGKETLSEKSTPRNRKFSEESSPSKESEEGDEGGGVQRAGRSADGADLRAVGPEGLGSLLPREVPPIAANSEIRLIGRSRRDPPIALLGMLGLSVFATSKNTLSWTAAILSPPREGGVPIIKTLGGVISGSECPRSLHCSFLR